MLSPISTLAVAAALLGVSSSAPLDARQNVNVQTPDPTTWDWAAGHTRDYTLHRSCNSTETALLRQALEEAKTLALHGKDHIMRFGNSSSFYTKYFGKANTAEPAAWLDKIASGDKAGVLFRCDDIDGNCQQDGWAGHWRGTNGSDETVICPLSYTSRYPLAGLCGYGYTVAGGKSAAFFAADLLHRIYHTDKMGEGVVGHYADTYDEVLELAKTTPAEAVRNSASLRYFALDVYAYDISVPGEGCTGESSHEGGEAGHGAAAGAATTATSASSAAASATSAASSSATKEAATPTTSEATSDTQSAATECHTHDDGVVHCA